MKLSHLFFVSLCVVALGVVIVIFARSSRQTSDASLISNFKGHEAQFQHLAAMAMQDPQVLMVRDSAVSLYQEGATTPYVYLYKGKTWPALEAGINFSELRWKSYRDAFQNIGLVGMERTRDLPGDVFFEASVQVSELDNDESAVITKGYAYIPGNMELISRPT
jgi:hypothetical protein